MKLEFRTLKAPPCETSQLQTVVFMDYESLFISFKKQFSIAPLLDVIAADIKTCGRISKINAFGDFTMPELGYEKRRLRTVTNNIFDCANETGFEKDHTDFIMLDQIYQEIIMNPQTEQYILVTGDGHFSSVSTFINTYIDKTIGVYGVTETLSKQLCDCATWAKEIHAIDGDETEYRNNLLLNLKDAEGREAHPTFLKTVEHTINRFGGDKYRYESILRQLINDGFVNNDICTTVPDRTFKQLTVNWDRVNREIPISS